MNKLVLFGAIPVNCFIIDNGSECYIIDPGSEKERIINFVESRRLKVKGILLTHAHLDHIGAIDAFEVPVYVHEKGRDVLLDDNLNGFNNFGIKRKFSFDKIDVRTINENSMLYLDDKRIYIKYTPGHTIGGVCYTYLNDMFVGDTLFENSVGRWDLPTSNLEMLKSSVIDIIDNTNENTAIHPGHGNSSTIGSEKKTNGIYLAWKSEREVY